MEEDMKCQAHGLCGNEADPTLIAYEERWPVKRFSCCRKCWEPGWDVPPEPPEEVEVRDAD
jgi:hypothetical protein